MQEGEFVSLLQNIFPLGKKYFAWDLARAWIENHYFDRLTTRTWKGNCYFPIPPQLVVRKSGGKYHAVLAGLVTKEFRHVLSRFMDDGGASPEIRYSYSQMVPAPLKWVSSTTDIFDRVKEELKIHVVYPGDIIDLVWTMGEIIATEAPLRTGYKRQMVWDWGKGIFVTEDPYRETQPSVMIEWMSRDNAPDYFSVSWDGDKKWLSHSRNWALLVAYSVLGEVPFKRGNGADLFWSGTPKVYLPLTFSRWLSCSAIIVPSPHFGEFGQSDYIYTFPTQRERDHFTDMFWNKTGPDSANIAVVFQNLLAYANRFRGSDEKVVPLPGNIRKLLNSPVSGQKAKELANCRFPARAIPGIEKTIAELGINRGGNG